MKISPATNIQLKKRTVMKKMIEAEQNSTNSANTPNNKLYIKAYLLPILSPSHPKSKNPTARPAIAEITTNSM